MSSPQTLDMQKKKEMDQLKILADQMARLGLDFGDMDLSVSKEDKPRKSKKLDSTNKSIDISNIAKKDSVREDSTPKSPSVSPKDKIEPSQDKKIIEEDPNCGYERKLDNQSVKSPTKTFYTERALERMKELYPVREE